MTIDNKSREYRKFLAEQCKRSAGSLSVMFGNQQNRWEFR